MSEPNSDPAVPDLDLDEQKVESWDEVKADYEVEPGGEPAPNSMAGAPSGLVEEDDGKGDDPDDGKGDDRPEHDEQGDDEHGDDAAEQ